MNVAATRHLTEWFAAKRPDGCFLYISTDQVYDAPGENSEAEIRPVNVYALTKLWSESLVRQLAGGLALRVNFFGPGNAGRQTFVDWIVESLREGRQITGFRDVMFNPLHVDHLSGLIVEMLQRKARGTFNLGASGGGISKADFIAQIAEVFELSTASCRVGNLDDVRLAAKRPRDMRMDVRRAEGLLGHALPTIAEGIALVRPSRQQTTHLNQTGLGLN